MSEKPRLGNPRWLQRLDTFTGDLSTVGLFDSPEMAEQAGQHMDYRDGRFAFIVVDPSTGERFTIGLPL